MKLADLPLSVRLAMVDAKMGRQCLDVQGRIEQMVEESPTLRDFYDSLQVLLLDIEQEVGQVREFIVEPVRRLVE
jgi:hypothetical protein